MTYFICPTWTKTANRHSCIDAAGLQMKPDKLTSSPQRLHQGFQGVSESPAVDLLTSDKSNLNHQTLTDAVTECDDKDHMRQKSTPEELFAFKIFVVAVD